MIKTFGRLLLAVGILVMTTSVPYAQATQEPTLITVPSPPVANQAFKVEATFFGPTTPCAFEVADYVGFGQPGLILINCDIFAPRDWVTQKVTVPGQHAGPYEVSFTSSGFSPQPTYATFVIAVADAPPVAVPSMTIVGASVCAVLLALFGIIFASTRRRS